MIVPSILLKNGVILQGNMTISISICLPPLCHHVHHTYYSFHSFTSSFVHIFILQAKWWQSDGLHFITHITSYYFVICVIWKDWCWLRLHVTHIVLQCEAMNLIAKWCPSSLIAFLAMRNRVKDMKELMRCKQYQYSHIITLQAKWK